MASLLGGQILATDIYSDVLLLQWCRQELCDSPLQPAVEQLAGLQATTYCVKLSPNALEAFAPSSQGALRVGSVLEPHAAYGYPCTTEMCDAKTPVFFS